MCTVYTKHKIYNFFQVSNYFHKKQNPNEGSAATKLAATYVSIGFYVWQIMIAKTNGIKTSLIVL